MFWNLHFFTVLPNFSSLWILILYIHMLLNILNRLTFYFGKKRLQIYISNCFSFSWTFSFNWISKTIQSFASFYQKLGIKFSGLLLAAWQNSQLSLRIISKKLQNSLLSSTSTLQNMPKCDMLHYIVLSLYATGHQSLGSSELIQKN